MEPSIQELFERNHAWSQSMQAEDPAFFSRLVRQQSPQYLWIGCSDSRVPANQIIGLDPGEVFVHRNVANVVVHSDLNALSVLQYAIDILRVQHILVVGHYGCGGVKSAMKNEQHGLVDNWLRHVQDVRDRHAARLASVNDPEERLDRLCELNALHQAFNVCRTTVLHDAWQRGQKVTVHAWCYSLHDGLITNLGFCASGRADAQRQAREAIRRLFGA
jgi:carbonic anhydrase